MKLFKGIVHNDLVKVSIYVFIGQSIMLHDAFSP